MNDSKKPRGAAKNRRRLSEAQRADYEQKVAILSGNIIVVPFAPLTPPPDAEPLLRALGLWDFAHLDLAAGDGVEIRTDLVAELIASYDAKTHRSWVRGARISVARADLAKALCLPGKRERAAVEASPPQEEPVAAMKGFVSSHVLFEFNNECILPEDVGSAMELVKAGQAHKIDWASLMWGLLERELLNLRQENGGRCCYAAHLQQLIKSKRPKLFEEDNEAAVEEDEQILYGVASIQAEAEVADASADFYMEENRKADEDCDGAEKTKNLDQLMDIDNESQMVGLSLGPTVNDCVEDSFNECKAAEEEEWRIEEEDAVKTNGDVDHCFQRCTSGTFSDIQFVSLSTRGGDELIEDERDDGYTGKVGSMQRMTSSDMLLGINSADGSYHDPGSGDPLAMGSDAVGKVSADHEEGHAFYHRNHGKRHIEDFDNEDENGGHSQHQYQSHAKRVRINSWEYSSPEFMALVVKPIQDALSNAGILLAQKEQELQEARMQLQMMSELVQDRDQTIDRMEKVRMDQQRTWQMELNRFHHEFNVMGELVVGYKAALKRICNSFAEYRKKYPGGDKPLYADVPGGGGLVLSVKELERLRLQKDEQTRRVVEEMVDKFDTEWQSRFLEYGDSLVQLQSRIDDLTMKRDDLIKERSKKSLSVEEVESAN